MFGVHGCIAKHLSCSDNILDAGHFSDFKHKVVSLSWSIAKISRSIRVNSISYFHILMWLAHLLEITFPRVDALSKEALSLML